MQDYFYRMVDFVIERLSAEEIVLCNFAAEDSDFVRFNRSAIRQAGSIAQRSLDIKLIVGQRQANGDIALSGDLSIDGERAVALVDRLRAQLPYLPEDPHLLYASEVESSDHIGENRLPEERGAIVEAILQSGRGRDLVGMYAAGGIHAGFANSLGQRNWFSTYTYNVDWSFYLSGDKAVKTADAGFVWDPKEFERKVDKVIAASLHAIARDGDDPDTQRRDVMRVWMLAHGGLALHRAGALKMRSDASFAEELMRIAFR